MSVCFLDNADLDFVTEVDHMLNYCYCFKCTCGKHLCPRQSPKGYPKSTFKSYYQQNFKRHAICRRPATSANPYRKNQFKLDSETTKSRDYQAWTPEKVLKVSSATSTPTTSKYRLSSNTTYKQDFTNWGTIKTESIVHKATPVNLSLKFSGVSTYSYVFQKTEASPSKLVKPHKNTNILCKTSAKTPDSTMKTSFQRYSPIPSKAMKHEDHSLLVPSHPSQFNTINRVNFNEKAFSSMIRRAHRSID
jgi:hypothetical protein